VKVNIPRSKIYQIMALTTFTGAWTNIIFGNESAGESVQSHRVLTSQQASTAAREEQNNAIPRTPVSLMDNCVVNKRPSLRGNLHLLLCAFPGRLKLEERRQILGNSLSLFINRNDVITVIQQHQLFFR
jgi:hypothetical protein